MTTRKTTRGIATSMVLLVAFTVGAVPAAAGPLTDLVMAPGVLADLQVGDTLRYAHDRQMQEVAEGQALPGAATGVPLPRSVVDGTVAVSVTASADGDRLVMTEVQDGATRPVSTFATDGPNPVLIYFLENVMRNMAAQTGGSPFYVRNVMRAELAAAAPDLSGPGLRTVTLTPFEDDPNAARMGDFAGLALALTFDPADPGILRTLSAQAGDGYRETMTLED